MTCPHCGRVAADAEHVIRCRPPDATPHIAVTDDLDLLVTMVRAGIETPFPRYPR